MYFNATLVVETSIIQGPLLKSGVPPPRSSGEVMTSSYPFQVFIDKSALKRVHIKIGISWELHFQFQTGLNPYLNWNFLSALLSINS